MIRSTFEVTCFDPGFGNDINVGTPCAHNEGRFVFNERPLYCEPGGNNADSTVNFKILIVAVFHTDVEHGRKPSAILGRHISLVERYIFYCIAIKHREETEQMGCIVNC